MCHNGNTLTVDGNAIQAHLKHGDKLGSCTSVITFARISNASTGSSEDISVSNVKTGISISEYNLSNYPNPFKTSTTINYDVPVNSKVSLKIYNALGQVIATLFEGDKKAGSYTISFNASKLIQGLYYCKLTILSEKTQFIKSIKLLVGK